MKYRDNLSLAPIIYFNDFGQKCIEVWKDCVGWETHYQISDLGRVKTKDRVVVYKDGRVYSYKELVLRQAFWKQGGYYVVGFIRNNKRQTQYVHILVAKAFIPNPEKKPEVNHVGLYPNGKEGNKLDNRAISLQWSTKKENINHSWDNGLSVSKKGIQCHKSKLTEEQVLEIRAIGGNMFIWQIAEIYGVAYSTIRSILTRKNWAHI